MLRPGLVLTVIAVLLIPACVQAATLHVATTGSDATGDGTEANPYQTIQHGIMQAADGDWVEVSQGVYCENIDLMGRKIALTGSDPYDPAVVAGTVIDGSDSGSVVTCVCGEDQQTIIAGFTIRNGRAHEGGGIYTTGSPIIMNNVICENETFVGGHYFGGGGICVRGGSPFIAYNTIRDNHAREGGAIGVYNGEAFIVSNDIVDNYAEYGGGGVRFLSSNGVVAHNVIDGNYTEDWDGGGVLVQWAGYVAVIGNVVTGNTANGGGGIAYHEDKPSGAIIGNVIKYNLCKGWGGGGGILCRDYRAVTMRNNVVCANITAHEGGGGVICSGIGAATIENCTIAQNLSGGGAGGGVAATFGSRVRIRNSIINANECDQGPQIGLWGAFGEVALVRVDYCDVEGGRARIYRGEKTILRYGLTNVDEDPLFAETAVHDDNGTPADCCDDTFSGGDYHLKSRFGRYGPNAGAWVNDAEDSLCIDAGGISSDFDLEPEPNGGRVNMGAYGNTAEGSRSSAVVEAWFRLRAPDDGAPLAVGAVPLFEFSVNMRVGLPSIVFCGASDFPPVARRDNDGHLIRCVRFPLRRGQTMFAPSVGQWRVIRGLCGLDARIYWRLEGRCGDLGRLASAPRSFRFDCGEITDLSVAPSHDVSGDTGIWPDRDTRPSFAWVRATAGMVCFHVDISTDPAVPLSDSRHTMTIPRGGTYDDSYMPTRAQWRRIRRLATHAVRPNFEMGKGTLYWRVRATDRDRLITCTSEVEKLVVDGGQWTVGGLDLSAQQPSVEWTHSGEGIVGYRLEFSVDEEFRFSPRYTLVVPARLLSESSYGLRPGEVRRLRMFAERNGLTAFYYRLRGEDGDRAFVTYSPPQTTALP